MNFGHFGALLALDVPQCQELWRWGRRRRESQEELPGTKNKRKQRKQHAEENQDKQKTTKKDTGAGTNNIVRVHKNTAYARLGV